MAGSNGWRANITADDWARNIEKRLLNQERRPAVSATTVGALLGPGFGTFSTEIRDWNGPETLNCGFFCNEPGAARNAPDTTSAWAGIVIACEMGWGVQILFSVTMTSSAIMANPGMWMRAYMQMTDSSVPMFSPWVQS